MFNKHLSFTNCVFVNRTANPLAAFATSRVENARGLTFIGNIFYNFNVGIRVNRDLVNTYNLSRICDNVFVDMATYAIEEPSGPSGHLMAEDNWYHNCTVGFSNLGDMARRNTALSANPLVDPVNNDWRINNVANGGAVIRTRAGAIDPLGIEPMEAISVGALLEPTSGGGGGGSPVTRSWWG